jgi:hypothetical protein
MSIEAGNYLDASAMWVLFPLGISQMNGRVRNNVFFPIEASVREGNKDKPLHR